MTNYNERLDEILQTLNNKARKKRASCTERNNWEGYNSAYERLENEAKQAILRWVADEVIGEDQPDIGESSHERNILRRQLREVLAKHGYKGDQR